MLMTQAQYTRHRNKSPQYIRKLYKAVILVLRGRLRCRAPRHVLDDKPYQKTTVDGQAPARLRSIHHKAIVLPRFRTARGHRGHLHAQKNHHLPNSSPQAGHSTPITNHYPAVLFTARFHRRAAGPPAPTQPLAIAARPPLVSPRPSITSVFSGCLSAPPTPYPGVSLLLPMAGAAGCARVPKRTIAVLVFSALSGATAGQCHCRQGTKIDSDLVQNEGPSGIVVGGVR
jgi:hypothetical protein